MKKKNFLFDPEEHGGEVNMYLYWLSIGTAVLGFIIWIIKQIIYAE
jgi:hypothetical protein